MCTLLPAELECKFAKVLDARLTKQEFEEDLVNEFEKKQPAQFASLLESQRADAAGLKLCLEEVFSVSASEAIISHLGHYRGRWREAELLLGPILQPEVVAAALARTGAAVPLQLPEGDRVWQLAELLAAMREKRRLVWLCEKPVAADMPRLVNEVLSHMFGSEGGTHAQHTNTARQPTCRPPSKHSDTVSPMAR